MNTISSFKIIKKTHGESASARANEEAQSQTVKNEEEIKSSLHPTIIYINSIKMDPNQVDGNIEQLETFKYIEKDQAILAKINIILAELKKFVAEIKISKSECQKTKIITEFTKKYKKLSDNDFIKQIDLTAPKKDRKPDINTTIWKSSKDTIYTNPTYLKSTPAQVSSFKTAFRKKKLAIPDDIKEKINANIDGNYTKLAIHKYEPEKLCYKKYTPEGFSGLSYY